ncbi:MAG: potassium channel protein [Candidatus Abyssobacteria bacterium SURF_5]|uniref:Potassium channel protein n=1 Tax=Abyssobacteria bacterium (strain SURF_5) TaxID=2093360 RepID=A0A3A4NZU4_ABYX5|nr:MAG: potassium channel protein [Candidatus Abyssubacteria bacterium SURF_5]
MSEKPEKRLLLAVALLITTIVGGTVGYRSLTADQYSWLDCFYMTVITLGTVGYGEVIDTSHYPAVRLFTSVLILFGMGTLAYSISTVTAVMVEMDLGDVFKRRQMNQEIRKMRNHFIICGVGSTGSCIAQELLKTGTQFVAIEREQSHLETALKLGEFPYIKGDATDDEVLLQAGINHASGLAAALSTEKDNLFLTLTARQLNPSIRIVARGLDESVNRKLRKAGADAIVSPAVIGGLRMASELIRPTVVSFLDTMLRDSSASIRFEEIPITPSSQFRNQTIRTARLRDNANLLVVAVKEAGASRFIYNPPPDTVLDEGMTVVVLGDSQQVQRLRKHSHSTAGS